MAEWLRRTPAKGMGSARAGSNPVGVVAFFFWFFFLGHNSTVLWRGEPGAAKRWATDSIPRRRVRHDELMNSFKEVICLDSGAF